MNGETRPERTALPLDVLDQIDRVCDRFVEYHFHAKLRPLRQMLGDLLSFDSSEKLTRDRWLPRGISQPGLKLAAV